MLAKVRCKVDSIDGLTHQMQKGRTYDIPVDHVANYGDQIEVLELPEHMAKSTNLESRLAALESQVKPGSSTKK